MTPRTLGVVKSYQDLLGVMRARASELGLSRLELDRLAKLQSGYAGKLLAPRPAKRLGMRTMGPVLAALGIQLVAVAEESAVQGDSRGLDADVHAKTVHYQFSARYISKLRKRGGQNSRKYLSRRQAQRLAIRAARARWAKYRASVAAPRVAAKSRLPARARGQARG